MTGWKSADMAGAWLAAAQERNRMMAAATERMFALASIGEGARVLDVGAGTGDTAFVLAHRVGLSGEVVATDVAQAMVEATAAAARDNDFANVKATLHDLGAPFPESLGPFDAVVARNVIMFVRDVPGALSRIRSVLRPGGRFAAVVWADLADNPFNAIPIEAVRARTKLPDDPPEVVKAFSLSDAGVLAPLLADAGFVSVAVERVPAVREFASLADAMKVLHDLPLYRELLSLLPEDERALAIAEIERRYGALVRPGGELTFPIVSLVAAGAAPLDE